MTGVARPRSSARSFSAIFRGGRNILGGDPAKTETTGLEVIVAASSGAPTNVGTHDAHAFQQVKDGAFADVEVLGNLAGRASTALADELIEAFDPVEAVG